MATKAPLKFLRVKQFRGSTKDFSLAFDSSKSLTLIYGENGSGKTTICDAFDFLGNGKVGSLENRGLGQIHPFWPTVGKSHADILVEMSIDGQTWQARANSKNVSITPVGSPPPKVEVLRRSSILRLVQDAPKEKYDALKPFIDISLVEQAETALRNQVKASSATLNTAANRIAENRDTLNRLFREAGGTETSALAWAANIVENPPKDPTKDVAALRAAAKAIEAVASLKDLSEAARLGATTAKDELDKKLDDLAAAESDGLEGDTAFERILSAAKNHFSQHAVGEFCPLCESKERVSDLALRVEERLSKLQALTAARGQVAGAKSTYASKQAIVDNLAERAKLLAATAVDKAKLAPTQWTEQHNDLFTPLHVLAQRGDLVALDVGALNIAANAATQLCSQLENKQTWYSTVSTVYQQYQSNLGGQRVVSKVLPRLEAALAICEQQRKSFLDTILSAIATDVGRLYEIIHPGDGLNKITLKLDPKKRRVLWTWRPSFFRSKTSLRMRISASLIWTPWGFASFSRWRRSGSRSAQWSSWTTSWAALMSRT